MLCRPDGASANDSEAGWIGTDLVLVSSGRVKMVSEDIRITQVLPSDSDWYVDARYLFENLTDDTLDILVAFPEPTIDSVPRFEDFRTLVRGVEVEWTVAEKVTDWNEDRLGRSYVFEVRFLPFERLDIRHLYGYHGSSLIGAVLLHYLTRTGRSWHGDIDTARFTVEMFSAAGYINYDRHYPLVDYVKEVVDKEEVPWKREEEGDDEWVRYFHGGQLVRTIFVFEQRDWVPERDFFLMVNSYRPPELALCDEDDMTSLSRRGESFFDLPDSLREDINYLERRLACYSDSAIRMMRNEIYALYGRPFADRRLHDEFYRQHRGDWDLEEEVVNIDSLDEYDREDYLYRVRYDFLPNRRYSDDLLNPAERRFIDLVRRIEQRRAARRGVSGD